jgi:hypothetical protein
MEKITIKAGNAKMKYVGCGNSENKIYSSDLNPPACRQAGVPFSLKEKG